MLCSHHGGVLARLRWDRVDVLLLSHTLSVPCERSRGERNYNTVVVLRVLKKPRVVSILVDMSSGAGKDAKEATINVGKTFAHITKFKEGAFSVWIMSITVTLMGVAEISTTMANVHTLLSFSRSFKASRWQNCTRKSQMRPAETGQKTTRRKLHMSTT